MTLADHPGPLACPGCAALPAQGGEAGAGEVVLSVPAVHFAGCIAAIERGLARVLGVREARVNLSLRRVRVSHDGSLAPEGLIEALAGLGFEALALDEATLGAADDPVGRDLLIRLAVAFFASMNVMALSVAVWSGAGSRDAFHLLSALIALPAVAFSGQPFFRSALASLRAGRLGMDVPISVALIFAAAVSLFEALHGRRHAYFEAAVMLAFVLLAGRCLDHRTRAAARSAARERRWAGGGSGG